MAYHQVDSDLEGVTAEVDIEACKAAIRGQYAASTKEQLPHHPWMHLCIIRGIRYNDDYGEQWKDMSPAYRRAFNARLVMTNRIPHFSSQEDIPYCIWHPLTASEETYRRLLQSTGSEYPGIKYLIGRACAVAGYKDLYLELNLLPDVHIAEEARECGSLDIFEHIMAQPVRYSIMNDYERSIDLTSLKPSVLNGDTAVRWMLDVKRDFVTLDERGPGEPNRIFNITEDWNVDMITSWIALHRLSPDRLEVRLLHEPLPLDLPTVQKDLLIAMAAYYGDIDRYVRLRRPVEVLHEDWCCQRGILHNTMFAHWWSKQQGKKPRGVQKAINARMIMTNIIIGAPYPEDETPYTIWWPLQAAECTYKELARRQPSMLPQIIHACIEAEYPDLFDELLPKATPTEAMVEVANMKRDPHYRIAIERRIQDVPQPLEEGILGSWHATEGYSSERIESYLDNGAIRTGAGWDWDNTGDYCSAQNVELNACIPDAWRYSADPTAELGGYCVLDYKLWPLRED